MILRQIRAIQALHYNYKWRGVWRWLQSPSATIITAEGRRITGSGWSLLRRYPSVVRAYQLGIADGVIW